MPIVVRHDVSPLFAGYAAYRAGEARGAVEMAQHMQRMALEREKLERANALEMLRLAMEHQMQQQMMPLRFMEAMQRNIALEQAQRRLGLQEKEHELRVAAFERAPELMEREHQQRLELSEREHQQRLELQRAKEAWEREQLRRRQEWEFISEQHKRISQWALDKLNRLIPEHQTQARSRLARLDQVVARGDLSAEQKVQLMNQIVAEIDALPEIDPRQLAQRAFENNTAVDPDTEQKYFVTERNGRPYVQPLSPNIEAEAKTYEARLKQWEAMEKALRAQIEHRRKMIQDATREGEDTTALKAALEELEVKWFDHFSNIPESPEFTRFKEAQRRSEQPQPSPKPTESRPPVEQPTPPPPPPEPELSLEEKVKAAYEAIKSSPVQIPDAPTEQQLAAMSPGELSNAMQPLADAIGKLVDQKKALNKAELERDIYNAGFKDVEARASAVEEQYRKIQRHLDIASEMKRAREQAMEARNRGDTRQAANYMTQFYALAQRRNQSLLEPRLSPDASVREFAEAHLRGLIAGRMPTSIKEFAQKKYWEHLQKADIPSHYEKDAYNLLTGNVESLRRSDAAELLQWANKQRRDTGGRTREALEALAAAARNFLSTIDSYADVSDLAKKPSSWTPADYAKVAIAVDNLRLDENDPRRRAVADYEAKRIIPSLEKLAKVAPAAGESADVERSLKRLADCLMYRVAMPEPELELLRSYNKRLLRFAHRSAQEYLPDVHALQAAINVVGDLARWQWAVMR